MPPEISWG